MAGITEFRPKERGADSEKITINLGYVDLGHISSGATAYYFEVRFLNLAAVGYRLLCPRIPWRL